MYNKSITRACFSLVSLTIFEINIQTFSIQVSRFSNSKNLSRSPLLARVVHDSDDRSPPPKT
jgi:hypothetical protein